VPGLATDHGIDRYRARKALTAFFGTLIRAAFWPGRLRVTGLEHVPRTGAFIFAPNHVSYADPPIAGAAIVRMRYLNYMAKGSLFRIPVLGGVMARVGAFPVEREGTDRAAIRHALELLKDGQALLMFPEGTRAPDETALLPSELGVAYIAARSAAQVIPVGLVGTNRVMPKGLRIPVVIPRRCEVRIGPPVELPMLTGGRVEREALEQAAHAIIRVVAALAGRPDPGVKGTASARWPESVPPEMRVPARARE
jgi:1-acyl-sn-glycerol-3-phosphate acyltransferase